MVKTAAYRNKAKHKKESQNSSKSNNNNNNHGNKETRIRASTWETGLYDLVCPAKTHRILCIRAVWSGYPICLKTTRILIYTKHIQRECAEYFEAKLEHNISYKIACPPSNDSGKPAQMRRLPRVIAWRSIGRQTSKLSWKWRQRFCLECVDMQADLQKCFVGNVEPRLSLIQHKCHNVISRWGLCSDTESLQERFSQINCIFWMVIINPSHLILNWRVHVVVNFFTSTGDKFNRLLRRSWWDGSSWAVSSGYQDLRCLTFSL